MKRVTWSGSGSWANLCQGSHDEVYVRHLRTCAKEACPRARNDMFRYGNMCFTRSKVYSEGLFFFTEKMGSTPYGKLSLHFLWIFKLTAGSLDESGTIQNSFSHCQTQANAAHSLVPFYSHSNNISNTSLSTLVQPCLSKTDSNEPCSHSLGNRPSHAAPNTWAMVYHSP